MCNCGPEVKIQEYQNAVAVDIPPHMESYREARVRAGLAPLVSIDRCALPEIRELWGQGIHTHGSCCGHNVAPSMVNVREEDDAAMVAMGYIRWPYIPEGFCKQTFFLRSIPPYAGPWTAQPSISEAEIDRIAEMMVDDGNAIDESLRAAGREVGEADARIALVNEKCGEMCKVFDALGFRMHPVDDSDPLGGGLPERVRWAKAEIERLRGVGEEGSGGLPATIVGLAQGWMLTAIRQLQTMGEPGHNIAERGKSLLARLDALKVGPGSNVPEPITFTDVNGRIRRIEWDQGDESVGLFPGWNAVDDQRAASGPYGNGHCAYCPWGKANPIAAAPWAVPDPKGPEAENKAFTEWFTWSGVGKEYEYAAREGWFARSRLKAQAGAAPNGSPYLPHPGGKEDRGICPGCSVDVFPPAYSCHTPGCGGVRKSKPGAPNGVREAGPGRECWVMWNTSDNTPWDPPNPPMIWLTDPPPLVKPFVWVRMVPAPTPAGGTDQAPAGDAITEGHALKALEELEIAVDACAHAQYEDGRCYSPEPHRIEEIKSAKQVILDMILRPVLPERPMEGGKA